MLLLGCKGLSWENIFSGGGRGVLNYLALRKWVCTSKQGMVCKSPEFNIGCKIFLSGLEAFSRG